MPQTQVTDYEINEWTDLSTAPATVTANGNRSYSLVFNSTDYTGLVQPGTRIRTTRTVAAPTQCTSLNGTTQYYSRLSASMAGMTFTNNFVVTAWVKLTSYSATNMGVVSRVDGNTGWIMYIDSVGRVHLGGYGTGTGFANNKDMNTFQSIPLNKWVHIAAQLDMTVTTNTATTNYIMIDGIDVRAQVVSNGTGPTALIQAGNLNIGAYNGGNFFPGKIAQAAVFNAKVTQATIQGYYSQGLAGNETSLISAYSFNNAITDLNTTNANNLTAQGSAVATNADSPFGGQAIGTISSTLDYGIVQSASFSTNTTLVVQVPEGCTIPTSGGVSTVAYSGIKVPYGMPVETNKWHIEVLFNTQISTTITVSGTWVSTGQRINIPTGKWIGMIEGTLQSNTTVAAARSTFFTLSNTTPTNSSYMLPITARLLSGSSVYLATTICKRYPLSTTTSTDYTLYATSDSISGTETALIRGDQGTFQIIAENSYL